jgi:hypothetical protein
MPSDAAAAELHEAAESRRQKLLRRLNLAPHGTSGLVEMRGQLLEVLARRDDLAARFDRGITRAGEKTTSSPRQNAL